MSQKGSTLSLYPSSVTCYNTAAATASASQNNNNIIIMNDHHRNNNNHSSSDDDDDDHDPSSKNGSGGKSRRELPSGAVATLKAWLLAPEHFTHPYPTPQDQVMLMQKTGIDKKQLKNWFTNARRRIWKPMLKKQLEAGKLAAGVSTTTGATTFSASLGGGEGGGEGGLPIPELMGSFQQQQQQQQQQRYSQHQQPEPRQEMYSNFQQAQTQQHQAIDQTPSYEQQQQQQQGQYQQQKVQFLQDIGQMHQQVREKKFSDMECHVMSSHMCVSSLLYKRLILICRCLDVSLRICVLSFSSPFSFQMKISPSMINMGIKSTTTLLPHRINSNIHINKTTNPPLATPITTTTTTTICAILILRTIIIIISPPPIPLDRCHP